MRQYKNLSDQELRRLQKRPLMGEAELREQVIALFEEVKTNGDQAVKDYTQKFDNVRVDDLVAPRRDNKIAHEVKMAINTAIRSITKFHKNQLIVEPKMQTYPGVTCWRESRPIRRVGLYVPGGTAPLLSTALMLGIPASLAGCTEIVLCTPPDSNGNIAPEIQYIAKKLGINEVYRIGGAQAIAAMCLGTEMIKPVDKLFGPGNQYVTAAKQYAYEIGTGIDMIAGPSEVMVIADQVADPSFVAADLLSQAEHGEDSQVVLLVDDESVVAKVLEEINIQLQNLPRKSIAQKSLENSFCIVFETIAECVEFANQYAPEHLILNSENATLIAGDVTAAGSVFIGSYAPESAGDYASGTNHTLPTNQCARSTSGLSLADFQIMIQFQELTKQGLDRIASSVVTLATAEGLQAHANAVRIRFQ